MNQALLIVGVFVFFISVYGAVMVGGHLLGVLERAEAIPVPAGSARPALRSEPFTYQLIAVIERPEPAPTSRSGARSRRTRLPFPSARSTS